MELILTVDKKLEGGNPFTKNRNFEAGTRFKVEYFTQGAQWLQVLPRGRVNYYISNHVLFQWFDILE